MREADHHQIQALRDEESAQSLNELLESFRLFNLTKLIKKSKNRNNLSQIVKSQLGTNIFTFKNFSIDKNGLELAEDYCFHKNNYDAVKMKIDLDGIKRIIEVNEAAIDRRLKNFGILNSSISDYRDNKLDYILNILTGDLAPSIEKKDIVEVKNFKHLRECIIKVDKLMDPVVMLDGAIMKHIQENFTTTEKDITSLFPDMTNENLNRWESEKSASGQIIIHPYNNIKYLIDPVQFLNKYEMFTKSIIYNDDTNEMNESQRDNKIFTADMLTEAGNRIVEKEPNAIRLFGSSENVQKLKQLINEYLDFKKTLIALRNANKNNAEAPSGSSFLARIANSIIMLFTRKEKNYVMNPEKKAGAKAKKTKAGISTETRDLYKEISMRRSPLLPISDFIEIKPDNESKIEKLITEMRSNNLKIIIPIYNARQMLYPQRSKKYLLSDVEYLMIDPEIAVSPDVIRNYIDSISGYKLKEDSLSGSALFNIEKYLMSIYRQNRAKMKRESK
ncbi:MAG: hypothetical protein CVV49_00730 [Spirochaetae bacterium HGW-Spirochaetae-5]|nr:MAG: hypothetical protein CVV49_00730 [Spirochaetae bacterium HGW-Spirochaetae-5]